MFSLDQLVQRGARRMLEAALAAEVEAYIQHHQKERDEAGHALVVRNGKSQERAIHSGAGVPRLRVGLLIVLWPASGSVTFLVSCVVGGVNVPARPRATPLGQC